MSDDAARPESIESALPGFVHDHGWTYRECPSCFQLGALHVYVGNSHAAPQPYTSA